MVLSVAGYVALSECDSFNTAVVATNLLGIVSLVMLAYALEWRRKRPAAETAPARSQASGLVRRFVG